MYLRVPFPVAVEDMHLKGFTARDNAVFYYSHLSDQPGPGAPFLVTLTKIPHRQFDRHVLSEFAVSPLSSRAVLVVTEMESFFESASATSILPPPSTTATATATTAPPPAFPFRHCTPGGVIGKLQCENLGRSRS